MSNMLPLWLWFWFVLSNSNINAVHAKSTLVSITKRSTYIVHMDKYQMPSAFSSHHYWYSSTVDSLKLSSKSSSSSGSEDKHGPKLVYTYNNAVHGFSALLSMQEVETLKSSRGFISAYKTNNHITLDTTYTPTFLSLNNLATNLWPASGYGEDVVIGVLDSGIWPESLSFKAYEHHGGRELDKWNRTCDGGVGFNSSLCNSKLIGVRYFNQALKANSGIQTNNIVDSARDTLGHGTHMSSIVAGNQVREASYFGYAQGTATGIAPRARIATYKVLWDNNQVDSSDVLSGFDQAIADGVDVVSISLGFKPEPLDYDVIAKASFSAMEKNILVSASVGNAGPSLGSLHNGVPWILTVTAGTIDRWFAGSLTLGDGLKITGWSMYPGNILSPNYPLVYNNTLSACNSTELLSEAPYAIIICGIGNVNQQMNAVSRAKLAGAILILDFPHLSNLKEIPCPCVVIRSQDAPLVINYAQSHHMPFASIKFKETIFGTKPTPVMTRYPSRGPARSNPNILKPDIMAPGSLVLGAWIPNKPVFEIKPPYSFQFHNDYNFGFGTSVACAHVSGVAALLKGAHPDWSVAAIKSAIMTTATPLDNTGKPIRDMSNGFQSASPLAMGAGQINPNRALDPGLIYDATPQDFVNLLCSMNFSSYQISSIIKTGMYNCSTPSSDITYPSFIVLYANSTAFKVQNFTRIATNVGKGVATYRVSVTAPEDSAVTVSPEILAFKEKYERRSYSVTVEYKGNDKEKVSFGELVWVEENDKHKVRSPIVISPLFGF